MPSPLGDINSVGNNLSSTKPSPLKSLSELSPTPSKSVSIHSEESKGNASTVSL